MDLASYIIIINAVCELVEEGLNEFLALVNSMLNSLCEEEEDEATICEGILAGTNTIGVITLDKHIVLNFESVKGTVIWALNIAIALQTLRVGEVAKVSCRNHLLQKASKRSHLQRWKGKPKQASLLDRGGIF